MAMFSSAVIQELMTLCRVTNVAPQLPNINVGEFYTVTMADVHIRHVQS